MDNEKRNLQNKNEQNRNENVNRNERAADVGNVRPETTQNLPRDNRDAAGQNQNKQNVINEPGKSVTPVKERKDLNRREEGGQV